MNSFSATLARSAAALLILSAGCEPREAIEEPGAILVSGRIEGDVADLAAAVPGRIVEISVREGDRVRSGEVLARLSGDQIKAARARAAAGVEAALRQLEQARLQLPVLAERLGQLDLRKSQASLDAEGKVAAAQGALAAAQADRARAEAEGEQLSADAERYAILAAKGAVSIQLAEQAATRVRAAAAVVEAARKQVAAAEGVLQSARASKSNAGIVGAEKRSLERQIESARGAVRVSEAQVESARAVLAQAEANVADLEVRAPFDGFVVTRSGEPGQFCAPGVVVLTVVDPSRLYLRGFIPQSEIGRVRAGQKAEIMLDSQPDRPLAAEVMRIDPRAMFTPENTYFQQDRIRQVVGVKLLISDNDGSAKIGMSAEARIFTESP